MDLYVLISLSIICSVACSTGGVGRTCNITENLIEVNGPSNFRDPSQYKYILRGISTGSVPTSFTWRREGVVLTSSGPYNITDPVYVPVVTSCSYGHYRSLLSVTGKVTGVFTYTVSKADTANNVVGTLTVEAADNPSNLMVRQNGRFSIEISWTLSATPPSRGYLLSNGSDPFSGLIAMNSPYTYISQRKEVGEVITIHLVGSSAHFYSNILGPKSTTIRDLLTPIITSSVSATSVTIILTQPMDSLAADQYTVTLTRVRGKTQLECLRFADTVTVTTSSAMLFEGLEEFSVYSVRVIAYTLDLIISNAAVITTLTAAPDAAPLDFTNGTVTSRSITLRWKNINCIQRNGRITSFDIQYGQVAGALTTQLLAHTSDNTSYTVEGLLPFTEYRFQIAGVNINGTGPYTTFIGPIRTDEDVPGAVTGLKGYVKFYSLELSWSPPQMPNGVLTGYNIVYKENGNSSGTLRVTTTSNPRYTIANLHPQTNISNITVIAHTSKGPGPSTKLSNIFITLSEPPMVTNVVVTVLTDTSVRVSWERLLISEITQYLVMYSLAGNRKRQTTESIIMVNSTENSVDITGLTTDAEYQFQVVAQALVEGEIVVGQRSSLTSMSVLVVVATLSPSTQSLSLVAITGVLVFISTVVLYSVILTLVLVAFYCHRNLNSSQQEHSLNEDINSKSVMELKECPAYGQFSAIEHNYEGITPATIEPEGVYDNI